MKRYAIAIIMMLGLSVLCGQKLTNTMLPAVHVRGPTVEQAVQDALTTAENQLIHLCSVAELHFRIMVDCNTITPAEGDQFINAVNQFDRLKSAVDFSLLSSFGIETQTELSPEVRFVAIAYYKIAYYKQSCESTNLQADMEQIVTVFLNSLTGREITISDSDSGEDEDNSTQASLAEVNGNEQEVARHMDAHY